MKNPEAGFSPREISEPEKARYEQLLWDRANELAVVRQALQSRLDELDVEFKSAPLESLNLHQQEERRLREDEYWRIKEKLDGIKGQESQIEQALVSLAHGTADLSQIDKLVARPEEESPETLPKRKQRILEEKQRLGIDPREIMADMYGEFGPEKMHLTTGRHAKRVKNLGLMTPEEAAAEFYYATTDTHGGKTRHGKKGDVYVSQSGKRIRKV